MSARREPRRTQTKLVIIQPGTDYEVISALRMLVAGKGDVVPEEVGGVAKRN